MSTPIKTPRPHVSTSIFALAALHLAGTDVSYELTFRSKGMGRKVARAIALGDDVALALIAGEDRDALFAHGHDGQTKEQVAATREAAKDAKAVARAAKVQASASVADCEAAVAMLAGNVHGFRAWNTNKK